VAGTREPIPAAAVTVGELSVLSSESGEFALVDVALGEVIQAPATFARGSYATAAFTAVYPTYDVVYFATRNNTANSNMPVGNQVHASQTKVFFGP
jgi:hypothetical protein